MFEIRSDEENSELLKEWMRRYVPTIVLGIVIALAIIFGLRFYEKRELDALHAFSYQLERLEEAVLEGNLQNAESAFAKLDVTKDNSYTQMASLLMAQAYQQVGEFSKAKALLDRQWKDGDALFSQALTWQRVHILLNLEEYDDALLALDGLKATMYAEQIPRLEGDIYYRQGRWQEALSAYEGIFEKNLLDEMRVQQLRAFLNFNLGDDAQKEENNG